jgi:preprotein translocase subunit SecA
VNPCVLTATSWLNEVGFCVARNTWQHNRVVSHQRRLLDEHRDRVLRADHALRDLATPCAARIAELRGQLSQPQLVEADRLISLLHLDRRWVEHLALVTELREAIHFRILAKQSPIVEFNRDALAAFDTFRRDVIQRSAATFNTCPITADGVDPALIGLKRPSATWTYLVHENPFGTEGERILKALAGSLRKRRDRQHPPGPRRRPPARSRPS